MKARSGVRNPAITSNREVLPAPDGPKSTVTRRGISRFTSRANRASGREMFFSSNMLFPLPAKQKFTAPHRGKSQYHRNAHQTVSRRILPQLDILENRQ